jgi:hypothetical protein
MFEAAMHAQGGEPTQSVFRVKAVTFIWHCRLFALLWADSSSMRDHRRHLEHR